MTTASFPADPRSFADLERVAMPGTVLDLDGTIVALNAVGARLLARPLNEVLGRKVWAFAPGLEYVWMERVAAIRASGEQMFEIAIATPTGARMIEYVVTLRELDGRSYLVAFTTDTRPLV